MHPSSEVPIPDEVQRFQEDCHELGMISDNDNWYITKEWAERFHQHLKAMQPLAEHGDPWAQYNVAAIYRCGYIYSSKEDAMKHHHEDRKIMSSWLEKAARQGMDAAIDNLMTDGVSEEAERLRTAHRNRGKCLE